MADSDKSGIERLREAAEKTQRRIACTGTALGAGGEECLEKDCYDCVGDQLIKIADQIEREHADELAAAKRDMTDEAREAVERLRGSEASGLFAVEYVNLHRAVTGEKPDASGNRNGLLRDRLCDLIEHGGKQDVDVEALREVADKADVIYRRNMIGQSDDGLIAITFGEISERIRKAIEGAQPGKCPHYHQAEHYCDVFSYRLNERDAAADWVEAHGGLEAVRDRMEMLDEFRSDVAKKVGVETNEDRPITLYGDVFDELDKRLMPPDMEWPRYEGGEKVVDR